LLIAQVLGTCFPKFIGIKVISSYSPNKEYDLLGYLAGRGKPSFSAITPLLQMGVHVLKGTALGMVWG